MNGSIQSETTPQLSICITTFMRGDYIKETLDALAPQMRPEVEIIVVDGNSPDNTQEVMQNYCSHNPGIRYIREPTNSGVDQDYDKAVSYAKGAYCWLMTDDDIPTDSAVSTILDAIAQGHELVILNASIKTRNLGIMLKEKQLPLEADRVYSDKEYIELFRDSSQHLSFIGCVVIRKSLWQARQRKPYYGSLFIHVGVIFQSPLPGSCLIIAKPLLTIRAGNGMWAARGFEIWMTKWPALLWSFTSIPKQVKQITQHRYPWKKAQILLYYRASGAYDKDAYRQLVSTTKTTLIQKVLLKGIATLPGMVLNTIAIFYFLRGNSSKLKLYDLHRSRYANPFVSWLAQKIDTDFQNEL